MNWRLSFLGLLLLLVTLGDEGLRMANSAGGKAGVAWILADEALDEAETPEHDGLANLPVFCWWIPETPRALSWLAEAEVISSRQRHAANRLNGEGLRLHRRLCVERC